MNLESNSETNKQLDFDDKRYSAYNELYRHYSSLIFKARISIITGIILAFGYILKVIPNPSSTTTDTAHIVIPICSSLFIAGIFMVEVAYSKRFFEVIACLRKIEGEDFYFSKYSRKHWQFSILYFYASLAFNFICFRELYNDPHHHKNWIYFFALCGPVSILALVAIYFELNYSYNKILDNKFKWWDTLKNVLLPSFVFSMIDFHFRKTRFKTKEEILE